MHLAISSSNLTSLVFTKIQVKRFPKLHLLIKYEIVTVINYELQIEYLLMSIVIQIRYHTININYINSILY